MAGAASVRSGRGALGTLVNPDNLLLNQVLAFLLLVLLSPVMGLVAFLIWRRDGAPIYVGHYRVGHDGRMFRCMKFRTMLRDSEPVLAALLPSNPQARAEWQRDQKLSNDPRITPVGNFLRRTSLDELPQPINVSAPTHSRSDATGNSTMATGCKAGISSIHTARDLAAHALSLGCVTCACSFMATLPCSGPVPPCRRPPKRR